MVGDGHTYRNLPTCAETGETVAVEICQGVDNLCVECLHAIEGKQATAQAEAWRQAWKLGRIALAMDVLEDLEGRDGEVLTDLRKYLAAIAEVHK